MLTAKHTPCDLRTLQGPMAWLAVRLAATLVLFAGLCAVSAVIMARQSEPGRLPSSFADYLNRVVKMPAADQTKLRQGLPVTRLLDADPSTEVAIFGAVWVNAPIKRYVAVVKDIESFEKGDNFLVTKKISSPPQLEDFAQLTLPQEDFNDLRSCKVGSCEVKLGQAALTRLQREVDWSKPGAKADVDRTMRALALDYVNAYLEGGNARLAETPRFGPSEIHRQGIRVDGRPDAVARGVSSGHPAPSRRISECLATRVDILRVLAGSEVRFEADHPHQSRHDRRAGRADRRDLEATVRKPLLLDGSRTARARARSVARRGFLVCFRKPQPIGRSERVRRVVVTRQSAQ